jgi:uncharacterized heparinase superfamily protein
MPPAELATRVRAAAHGALDRWRAHVVPPSWRREHLLRRLAADVRRTPAGLALAGRDWPAAHAALLEHVRTRPSRFLLSPSQRIRTAAHVTSRHPGVALEAAAKAARIAEGTYDLLGYEGVAFTDATGGIDWHLDPVSGRRMPRAFWADVDYLDPQHGDHKVVWELNRHQHWLALGRGWWLTGDRTCRRAFVGELESWLRANPPLVGANWASALELAFRALSWLWALHFFATDTEPDEAPWAVDLLLGLDRQLRHLERNLSWYFSPNTHLLGEGLALYVCGRVLPELGASGRWAALGRRVLVEERTKQVLADGAHVERSPHYHRYALDFYALALAVARVTEDVDTAEALAPVVDRMATWLHRMADGRGRLPLIGDDDGGELFPIDGLHPGDARVSLGWAADLLDRPDLRVDPVPEAVTWLTLDARTRRARGADTSPREGVGTVPPEPSGYVVLRRGSAHLVFDGGRHGFLNGGHAHADALAVTLGMGAEPLLVDPGTATYTMDPALRDRFRSSAMHNTLVLDGRSQSVPNGPFHWASVANGQVRRAVRARSFDYVRGDTDAWTPVTHQRHVLAVGDDTWLVADEVIGDGSREATVHWHLHPQWTPQQDGASISLVHERGGRAWLAVLDARVDLLWADAATGLGWMAPAYGRLVPTHAVRATRSGPLPCWLATIVTGDEPGATHTLARADVQVTESAGASLAVLHRRGSLTDVMLVRGHATRGVAAVVVDAERTLTTDARVLHARLAASGALVRLCAVDASHVALDGRAPFALTAPRALADVAVRFDPHGTPIVESDDGAGDITLDIDIRRSSSPAIAARHARQRGAQSAAASS